MSASDTWTPEALWRDVVGRTLRDIRHSRGERLTDTAGRAGISAQYLSEIERGRKEPSSEMIAAVAGALDLRLVDLVSAVASELRTASPTAAPGDSTAFALAA